LEFRRQNT